MSNRLPTRRQGPSTASVHAGEPRVKAEHSITNPIFQTSTFVFDDLAEIRAFAESRKAGTPSRFEYGRYGNPTEEAATAKLVALEGGEDGILFASGMTAATTTILALLSAGDHMVITDEAYKKTREFALNELRRFHIACTIVPPDDYDAMRAALRPNTKLFFTETPTNPRLWIVDLTRVAEFKKDHPDMVIVVDSTFGTPVNYRPLSLGADVALHSATKYLGGHNDILGGAIVGSREVIGRVRPMHQSLGGIMDPHCAYLLVRGLKTLAVRVARHNENAQRVAEFLEGHPKVGRVYYPGLKSHPQHDLARRQMTGFGGVVSFEAGGTSDETFRFIEALTIPYLGPSLGGVETLVYHPASLTFDQYTPSERLAIGITDTLVRLAIGIEDADDLIADLDQALAVL